MSEKRLINVLQMSVRWGDMDAYGHVNNTVYFRYAEQCRWEWLEKMELAPGREPTEGPVIVNASCTFLIPITYPATLEIRMYAGDVGRSSVETHYEIRVLGDARLYAEGSAKVVWIDMVSGKSKPLPEALRAQI